MYRRHLLVTLEVGCSFVIRPSRRTQRLIPAYPVFCLILNKMNERRKEIGAYDTQSLEVGAGIDLSSAVGTASATSSSTCIPCTNCRNIRESRPPCSTQRAAQGGMRRRWHFMGLRGRPF